ncbi:uncharacterized protein [Procambarus clarkii]|uniref:uncharacterized protein n=1 Tax=Procambarus clarkii TaxID=6728 RepID=UPI003743136B
MGLKKRHLTAWGSITSSWNSENMWRANATLDGELPVTLASSFGVDRARLGELQQVEFPELIREAKGGRAGPESATHFYLQNEMLMRQWRPVRMEAKEESLGMRHQVVLPAQCRAAVLDLSHSVDSAGHLRVTKTLCKIRDHFYWPGMDADGVTQIRSSPYRPQSQGAIERFLSTLKTILRVFCAEQGAEWDEAVYPALFAIRNPVVESLGFSPFQLVYGHEIRSPLSVLREQWAPGVTVGTVSEYVQKFKERLALAKELAGKHLKVAQRRVSELYYKKATPREFQVGSQVMVLLPGKSRVSESRFEGPYKVLR